MHLMAENMDFVWYIPFKAKSGLPVFFTVDEDILLNCFDLLIYPFKLLASSLILFKMGLARQHKLNVLSKNIDEVWLKLVCLIIHNIWNVNINIPVI